MDTETFAHQPSILNDNTKNTLEIKRCNNQIYVSHLNHLAPFSYTSLLSIKYVYDGLEQYRVNGINNKLLSGHCLIVNDDSNVLSECGTGKDENEMNHGMSIFLTPAIVSEVLTTSKIWPKDILPEYTGIKDSMMFYDGIIKTGPFVNYLKKQFLLLSTGSKSYELDESYYYTFCENLLHFQCNILKNMDGINKVRYSTRQEILKRVFVAKEIIDGNYLQNLDLNYLSKESCLSKYFLIKSFKQVFNITPHQYHIHLKINKAKELLKKNNSSISAVAASLGYANIFAFSRQFQRATMCSPSAFKDV